MKTPKQSRHISPELKKQVMEYISANYIKLIASLCRKYQSRFCSHQDFGDIVHDVYIQVCQIFFYDYNYKRLKDTPVVILSTIQQLQNILVKPAKRLDFDRSTAYIETFQAAGHFFEDRPNSTFEDEIAAGNLADEVFKFIASYHPDNIYGSARRKMITAFLKCHFILSVAEKSGSSKKSPELLAALISDLTPERRLNLFRKYREFYHAKIVLNVSYIPKQFNFACDHFLVQLRKSLFKSGFFKAIFQE